MYNRLSSYDISIDNRNELIRPPILADNEISLMLQQEYRFSNLKIYSIEGIEVRDSEYIEKIDVYSFSPGVCHIKFGIEFADS